MQADREKKMTSGSLRFRPVSATRILFRNEHRCGFGLPEGATRREEPL